MLADPRARPAVAEFYRQWLGLGALDRLVKDAGVYPEFDARAAGGHARRDRGLRRGTCFRAGDRTLADAAHRRRRLRDPGAGAAVRRGAAGGTGPQPVTLPPAERAGLLTQAGVLAVHALPDQSSPVHRGKFVREQILCQEMPPQPPDLMVTPPEVDPRRPTRERFAQHAEDPALRRSATS